MTKVYTKYGEEVTPIWLLKEFWVNIVIVVAMIATHYYTDFELTPELTITILALINLILRAITGKPITWYPVK